MKDKYRTPQLLPGAWYVTYTSDERMAPVYVQPVNIERNINGDYVADLKDNTLGEINVKEGDKLFAFYARVQLPVEDRDNPVLLETLPQSGYTRDVAFDIVGNIYVVSSSSETLRIWSPGGDWVAITRSDGTFTLTPPGECPGDVDGDGDTDLNDLAALLTAYGSFVGDPNYNPAADFDSDTDVDLNDLAFLLSDYGCLP